MKAICSSCEAIRQMTSDYSDPSILCPVCRASNSSHSALPGTHKARRDDDDDDDDDDRPRKKKPASSDSNTGSKVAGAAAGMGIGMIVVIVVGLLGCCVCLPATGVGLTWMAINKVKNAAESAVMVNNMKNIGLSAHRYHDIHKHFPSPQMQAQLGKDKAPELSWRVTILENDIFQGQTLARFDRSQNWDSDKNKLAMGSMPGVYLNPLKAGVDGTQTQTQIQYFTGPNTPFPEPLTKIGTKDVMGTSNKFLCAEAQTAVPWTKPVDMVAAAQGKLPMADGKFVAAMFDGTVRIVNRSNASDEILRKAIDPKVDQPWQDKWNN